MTGAQEVGRVAQIQRAMEMIESEDQYEAGYALCWDALTTSEREVLNQLLHTGPVWDGNVISKSDRNTLIRIGLAVRCCFKGEAGYTAASYAGLGVFKAGKAKPFKIKAGSEG